MMKKDDWSNIAIEHKNMLINPLIDWDDEFLWWYIKHEGIETILVWLWMGKSRVYRMPDGRKASSVGV